jgi:hypothetical protein
MTRTSELKKEPIILWEKLPENFPRSDEPVENICQPLLAAALTEALDLGGLITSSVDCF